MQNFDFLYDKEYFSGLLNINHFQRDKKLSYKVYDNAIVLPYKQHGDKLLGGVLTKDGKYLDNTSLHATLGEGYEPGDNYLKINESVIYIGMLNKIWGHFITDDIRRMWFLLTDEYREHYSDCKIVYVPFADFNFGVNFKSFLEILGIDSDSFVPITEICSFRKIIIPDECFYTIDGRNRFYQRIRLYH